MLFNGRKDRLFNLIFISMGVIMLCLIFLAFWGSSKFFVRMILTLTSLLVIGYLIWIYLDTSYTLVKERLNYRSGLLKGSIDIQKIHEVIRGKTMWAGNRAATARNGLIIKYERFNSIYISPEQEDVFLQQLLAVNPDIKILQASESPVY